MSELALDHIGVAIMIWSAAARPTPGSASD
jgi:hypothetical protein